MPPPDEVEREARPPGATGPALRPAKKKVAAKKNPRARKAARTVKTSKPGANPKKKTTARKRGR
jgi:hypothetical protein